MAKTTFYGNGEGKWIRIERLDKCSYDSLFFQDCQGCEGHSGPHWVYSPAGFLQQVLPNGDYLSIPPDNKDYVHPMEMIKNHHSRLGVQSEVTDLEEIERLNRGEIFENESMFSPITDPERIAKLKALKEES